MADQEELHNVVSMMLGELNGSHLGFTLGGGGPIPFNKAATTVPHFRFLLGVVYAPTERDTDGDGIPDKNDTCPTQAGARGGDRPGCPNPSLAQ